jgi:hypothetical protein
MKVLVKSAVDARSIPTYKKKAAARYPGPLMKGDDVEESQFRVSSTFAGEDEYVEFWPAGTLAKGQFACTACGNRVTVHTVLPRCMVCGERLWERADWSPFARSEAPS